MNKKRKILTLAAPVAFSVIIALHYGWWPCYHPSYTSDPGWWGLWPWPLIRDVRMPLFVLAVFYAGFFFILGPSRGKKSP
jgi:hypothetical protein